VPADAPLRGGYLLNLLVILESLFEKSLNIEICLREFTCEETKIENLSVWKNIACGSEKILIRTWLC